MTEQSRESGKRRLVLLIDDNEEWRVTLQMMLEDMDYEAIQAADAIVGEKLLAQEPVDLIMIDIMMPHKSGNEAIFDFRKTHPALPIIAMSGGGRSGNTDFLEFAIKQGADAALTKPCDIDELALLLEKIFK